MPACAAVGSLICRVDIAFSSLCMPCTERLLESRMRQIRTSGSTRGRVTVVTWPADLLPRRPKGLILWKLVAYTSLVSLSTLLSLWCNSSLCAW